ncbi:putative membrane protein (TIGR02226 family) [Litorimonas taeanensis]|uniref:Putative membrane protein (TIGR02226 family) n=1 Tax=Litorimonas taeanensis TaxID=568099 RepID=A0A420WJM5_9PROT|nr:DUF4159 domain-containing protein [Litorimonas taeanensis]RKQ71224.1 putative membrane protein (TIGR02226 family) [Litorimonas taeanensis]
MGGFTFLAPLALLGLLSLPVIWWILRIAPPTPKPQSFPPLQLFSEIETDEETPAKTPLWLLLFRIAMVALITFSLAGPILKRTAVETENPLVLLVDNSWLSAPFWSEILNEAENQLKSARRRNIEAALVLSNGNAAPAKFAPAQEHLEHLKTLKPEGWIDNSTLTTTINSLNLNGKDVVTLSSGLSSSALSLAPLEEAARQTIYTSVGASNVALPVKTQETPNGFETVWRRPIANASLTELRVQALGSDNSVLGRADLQFAPGEKEATARFELPSQLRNRVVQLRLEKSNSAGSVYLLDDAWGRPLIGLLSGAGDTSSPLLSEPFYARTALQPYADIFDGDLDSLLSVNPALIIMPDSQRTTDQKLIDYVEKGGVLVRFAGPKLAKRNDVLLPVELRSGGRAIGGALSWETPQTLAPFESNSPFFGLDISEEITVSRQVMAEPGIETDTRSWARLADGSPIVTASPKEDGLIVLFHVTAGPEWSNLALSGLYVDMLRRILPLAKTRSRQVEENNGGEWVAIRVLNGFGQFDSPDAKVRTIADEDFNDTHASSKTPAGFYIQGTRQKALQTLSNPSEIKALEIPSGMTVKRYGGTKLQSLAGLGLAIGLIGLALDALFALIMSGRKPRLWPQANRAISLAIGIVCTITFAVDSQAQNENKALEAATGLHFAYIQTDNGRIDRLTENGLESLGKQLDVRTTIDVVGVHKVDPAIDELSFYPFLYWVISRDAQAPSEEALTALNAYMASGGTIVFDTRDAADRAVTGNSPHPGLTRVTGALDIPRLKTVPSDHVLTKAFYLLQSFPGRWANGQVWVDAASNAAGRDGVSPVIIGGHDWAAAWALDDENRPIIDTDESLPRQREFAARFGVNLAMYTLAGNYKADQVHTAELVERLGNERARDAGFDTLDEAEEDTTREEVTEDE